ncbi:hypothetical protein [Candidatus Poriferisocius sp.]|uniref:hypothetical protein n=1 Tax=Candidatus Poriferisocius sp. TaxID=3101276 RepID=UPI003B02A165
MSTWCSGDLYEEKDTRGTEKSTSNSPQGDCPVPAGESKKRTDPGWYVDPGTYTIWTARSSADLVHAAEMHLSD